MLLKIIVKVKLRIFGPMWVNRNRGYRNYKEFKKKYFTSHLSLIYLENEIYTTTEPSPFWDIFIHTFTINPISPGCGGGAGPHTPRLFRKIMLKNVILGDSVSFWRFSKKVYKFWIWRHRKNMLWGKWLKHSIM